MDRGETDGEADDNGVDVSWGVEVSVMGFEGVCDSFVPDGLWVLVVVIGLGGVSVDGRLWVKVWLSDGVGSGEWVLVRGWVFVEGCVGVGDALRVAAGVVVGVARVLVMAWVGDEVDWRL